MKEPSAKHATFVIERHYKQPPEQVFASWANPEAKSMWFTKSDKFEFRVGGREFCQGTHKSGPIHTFDACYQDIVQNVRIVYTYTMNIGNIRISVSVTTVEFRQSEGGTKLILTEQGVFLDGHDYPEQREHGMKELLDKLSEALNRL